jgi:hypothetical protein
VDEEEEEDEDEDEEEEEDEELRGRYAIKRREMREKGRRIKKDKKNIMIGI